MAPQRTSPSLLKPPILLLRLQMLLLNLYFTLQSNTCLIDPNNDLKNILKCCMNYFINKLKN